MNDRLIKPKVFLSHSKSDADFVRHLHGDLQRCQIDPWIDEIEIRTGKPWLDVIFEDGLPTCDSVFVYLTDVSIKSAMVKKEIDAGIIQQLKDRRVAFLPYVDSAEVRKNLRADIKTLHVPVWNTSNYHSELPRFVAEVWRSFTERMLHSAVQEEENKRLKAEIELQKLTNRTRTSVFSSSEDADFNYVWSNLDYPLQYLVLENVYSSAKKDELLSSKHFRLILNAGSLFAQLPVVNKVEYVSYEVNRYIANEAGELIKRLSNPQTDKIDYQLTEFEDFRDRLLMFGLIQSLYVPPQQTENTLFRSFANRTSYRYLYTERMFRFRYWLAYNKLLQDGLMFNEEIEVTDTNW